MFLPAKLISSCIDLDAVLEIPNLREFIYTFVDLKAAAAAGTSSSLGNIFGRGPTGVILCSALTRQYSKATSKVQS